MVEELLIAGSLRCPSCGALQPEDRPVCLECGLHFTANIQILASRRPLGLPPIMLGILGVSGLMFLAASILASHRSQPTAEIPQGVDIFSPPSDAGFVPLPPPPALAPPTIENRTAAKETASVVTTTPGVSPIPKPEFKTEPPVRPAPLPAPVRGDEENTKVGDLPATAALPESVAQPEEDSAETARRRQELLRTISAEFDREYRMVAVGEYTSLPLKSGGVVEGQVNMFTADSVMISYVNDRKRTPFSEFTPEARLRLDRAYRRSRILEEVQKRLGAQGNP